MDRYRRVEHRRWPNNPASFDFAQDEVILDMPLTTCLLLGEVEGRSAPLQPPDVKEGASGRWNAVGLGDARIAVQRGSDGEKRLGLCRDLAGRRRARGWAEERQLLMDIAQNLGRDRVVASAPHRAGDDDADDVAVLVEHRAAADAA